MYFVVYLTRFSGFKAYLFDKTNFFNDPARLSYSYPYYGQKQKLSVSSANRYSN